MTRSPNPYLKNSHAKVQNRGDFPCGGIFRRVLPGVSFNAGQRGSGFDCGHILKRNGNMEKVRFYGR